MPLRLPDRLPAIELLKHENIFVMDDTRAHSQDIRPLKIAILNLMPLKITTETDLIRLLSNTPLQLEISFMKLRRYRPLRSRLRLAQEDGLPMGCVQDVQQRHTDATYDDSADDDTT